MVQWSTRGKIVFPSKAGATVLAAATGLTKIDDESFGITISEVNLSLI